MVNFKPMKGYMFYLLDRIIEQYKLRDPFLDVGCGTGDLSTHMSRTGWTGTAIDTSERAIAIAREDMDSWVTVMNMSLFDMEGKFNTIFLWDVLEHIEDDGGALKKVSSLLSEGGSVLLTVPIHPDVEWRWDDEFYGHHRRYAIKDIANKLYDADFRYFKAWDFTFPVFWAMRRVYTKIVPSKKRTEESAIDSAWDSPIVSLMNHLPWRWIYPIQYMFRNDYENGHEMFMLVRK